MAIAIAWVILLLTGVQAEEVGARWGTEQREREYYRVVSVPIPKGQVIEAGAFELMPDNRMAIGTRRGDIYFMSGVDDDKPRPRFDKFAEGLDEIFGLAHRKGEKDTLYVTHSAELTRVRDTNGDGRADRFETVSDAWGYRNYHEYAFGSKFPTASRRPNSWRRMGDKVARDSKHIHQMPAVDKLERRGPRARAARAQYIYYIYLLHRRS